MTSREVEKALQRLLGDAVGPSGIVVTVRRHDDYEKLLEVIDRLEESQQDLKRQVLNLSSYAELYLTALDDVRDCCRLMNQHGIDTSFVRSLRR